MDLVGNTKNLSLHGSPKVQAAVSSTPPPDYCILNGDASSGTPDRCTSKCGTPDTCTSKCGKPDTCTSKCGTPNGGYFQKRDEYIDWTEYFMATAFLAAKRSKDPSYQVGACIVNRDKKIVGVGYNGMPIGCSDDDFPWGKNTPSPLDNKHLYVCHAEMNAILNKNAADVKNCTIYVGLFPCNECAKMIIQSGITEVVYMSDKGAHKPIYIASKRMFDASGVKYWQYIPKRDKIEINFVGIDWDRMSPSK